MSQWSLLQLCKPTQCTMIILLLARKPLVCFAVLPPPEQLDQTELRFLEDFCNLMVTAHYRLLTEQEWQTATDEEFTVPSLTT